MKITDARQDEWRKQMNDRREIAVFGPITEEMAHDVIHQLRKMDGDVNDQRPITLMIDSYGGEIYGASGINAAIDACKHDVDTVAVGKAMSAGFSVFMRGKKRTVHVDSWLLAHTASIGFGRERVKTPDLSDDVNRVKLWLDREAEVYAKACGEGNATIEFWTKILHGKDDVTFRYADALGLGIATDGIGWKGSRK